MNTTKYRDETSRHMLLGAAVLALAALACSSAPTVAPATDPAPTAAEAPSRPFEMGVAGLIPRNFPNPSEDDWLDMYESLHETGELLGVYTNWAESPQAAGEIPDVVTIAFGLAPRYGFTPLVGLGFDRDTPDGGAEFTISWDDPASVDKLRQAVVSIAQQHQPKYLALGGEINRYYERDPAWLDQFVTVYAEMYDSVKAVSPQTLVFPVFQLEMNKGAGYLLGGSQSRSPQFHLLDRFGERLDVAAFTTYPFLDYTSPADIPEDYYAEIAAHTSRPIAFTEIGWPSAPLATAPDSEYGGSPDEQAAFVRRFFQLTANTDLILAVWAFPHDLGSGSYNAAMGSVSLRHNDGTPKPALEAWQEFVYEE